MDQAAGKDKGLMSLKEVVERTGIPAATIRYYDQQFEEYLGITRGAGRRRLFSQDSLGRLGELRRLLKDEGLSLRQARKLLSGDGGGPGDASRQGSLQDEVAALRLKVQSLEEQVMRLKEIQSRTLALVDGLTQR
ncbi:MAG: helix-turn-helix domain-containing protein [Desulfarculaceae bacterium]|nr:helix-turn-helix domain-containing protein [Desulfarculaceae bacterium]MCF8047578.1 helix-turn-helix domain-containing protein [Desulfarculaceae bacterium]MCF8099350.1 helix-turn-helix domain-containing protein [Desulfarculaceae bacterium]MCF8123399.1 helix-turn-helix domain-containing protein [Desulfarculaceae bacterium]